MKRADFLYLAIILIIGFFWRFLFLLSTNSVIDSDEAIVGLMARHILAGEAWPIFYYGQNYMGSFEAILTAGVFWLIGPSSFALKTVPLIFSLYLIVVVYFFTKAICSTWAARVAALFAAISPSALTVWSTMARGGFIEIVALGSLSLLLAYLILVQAVGSYRRMTILGFVVGLGWWINNQMIYYAIAAFVVYLIFALKAFRVRDFLSIAAVGSVSFFLGSLAFWYANLLVTPRFATFKELLGRKAPLETGFVDHLAGMFTDSLPILVGAARFWSDTEVFYGAKVIFLILYLLVLVLFCNFVFSKSYNEKSKRERLIVFVLFLSFFLAVTIIFSASSFGWLSRAPRYLLPLYSILFPIIGVSLYQLRQNLFRKGMFRVGNLFSFSAVAILLSLQSYSNFYNGSWYRPGQPIIFEDDRVSEDHTELYKWLEKNNKTHIHTNYWIGYRVAFETAERVTFTRYGEPRDLRISSYEKNEKLSDKLFVVGPKEARKLEDQLSTQGFYFKKDYASGYILISEISPSVKHGELVEILPEMVTVTHRKEAIEWMLDNDPNTRWGSGAPQSPGMAVEVNFETPTEIAVIAIDYGEYQHDVARGLLISAIDSDGKWRELFRLDSIAWKTRTLVNDSNVVNLEFAHLSEFYLTPTKILKLRIEQTGSHPVFDWSIAKLELFASAKD